ncbi:CarD family transcriptional regulator [Lentibacillus jeotgali]|uniref:CarD family transcriptional regulator n=1 Tax=Lentibacillus jeotgali TaxID=558169 RepID=UPI0002628829|nr:CarD family transcriptional regulator [Lentibacillus jeotgali]
MFNIGDTIIYSTHGLCKIDDISERDYSNSRRTYYVMHPIESPELTINTPVNNDQSIMLAIMDKDEAERVLHSFKDQGIQWIDDARQRHKHYSSLINTGNRTDICKVANTLLRRELETHRRQIKMQDQDRKLLEYIKSIMFKELAISLDTSYENIAKLINSQIKQTA